MAATYRRTPYDWDAKRAMTEAENYIRDLVGQLREDDILDHHPEIAALADEAQAHTDALKKARFAL